MGAILALQYNLIKDFEPVSLFLDSPMLIVPKIAMPAKDLKELVAWLKANPDKASLGTPGVGGASQLAAVLFQNSTGTRFQFVPYRGNGPAMQDMIAGRIDLMFDLVGNSLPACALAASRPMPSWPRTGWQLRRIFQRWTRWG